VSEAGFGSEGDILVEIAYDEAWINAAMDCLTAKRFTGLDEDVLVDLIDEVARQLDLTGDEDAKSEDTDREDEDGDDEDWRGCKDCLGENH
jgi:hypothetical protein